MVELNTLAHPSTGYPNIPDDIGGKPIDLNPF